MNALLQLIATLAALFFMDAVWLKFIAGGMVDWPAIYHYGYRPNWPFAEIYYIVAATWVTFGLAYPAMHDRDPIPAFTGGGGLGFRISLIYAAVHQVFFTPWPLDLILMDILWNTFMFAVVAVLSTYAGLWLQINYPEKSVRRT